MKKIESLVELASFLPLDEKKFKENFKGIGQSIAMFGENVPDCETMTLILGYLSHRKADWQKVYTAYWTTILSTSEASYTTEDFNSFGKVLTRIMNCAMQEGGPSALLDVINGYLRCLPTGPEKKFKNVLMNTVGRVLFKMKDTDWEKPFASNILEEIIKTCEMKPEYIVVKSLEAGNEKILKHVASTHGLRQEEAAYVITRWAETITQYVRRSKTKPKNSADLDRMFPIAVPFIDLNQLLGLVLSNNRSVNFGHLREWLQEVNTCNDVSSLNTTTSSPQEELDLIIRNMPIPQHTPYEKLIEKLTILGKNEFTQAQNWLNHINRQKMAAELEASGLSRDLTPSRKI